MLQLRGQLARKVRETMACYRYQSWCRYIQFLNSVGSREHKLKINSVLSWSAPELVSRPILRTRCDELQNQGDPHRLRKKNDEVVSRMVSLANRGDAIERDHMISERAGIRKCFNLNLVKKICIQKSLHLSTHLFLLFMHSWAYHFTNVISIKSTGLTKLKDSKLSVVIMRVASDLFGSFNHTRMSLTIVDGHSQLRTKVQMPVFYCTERFECTHGSMIYLTPITTLPELGNQPLEYGVWFTIINAWCMNSSVQTPSIQQACRQTLDLSKPRGVHVFSMRQPNLICTIRSVQIVVLQRSSCWEKWWSLGSERTITRKRYEH